MNIQSKWVAIAAAALLAAAPFAMAQNEGQGQGQATVTVLPKGNVPAAGVAQNTVHVMVDGRKARITQWQSDQGAGAPVELVLLIDDSARLSLGRELGDIRHFVRVLPPNVKFAMAYMEYGQATLAGPLTTDRDRALKELHLPAGVPGANASPYFCLSWLAKHWPSNDPAARREVIMITNGVDYYDPQFDLEDPYVQSSIRDSLKAGLVVYSIYWQDTGLFNRTGYATNLGQDLLSEVAEATGGELYWIGYSNPVSLTPYFDNFLLRLKNQYELGFNVPLRGKPQVETLKVKVAVPAVKVTAPRKAWVALAGANPE